MKKNVNGIIMDMTAEEIAEHNARNASAPSAFDKAIKELRFQRDKLLSQTDWWGASDNTITDAQKKYRQELRDLPSGLDTVEKVEDVTWPTKPKE